MVTATATVPMTDPPGGPWLSPAEREAWLGLVRVMARLPSLLDGQLERTAGLTFFGYTILAILSEQEDRSLRMSRLAALTDASPSKLSHAARQLEARGWIRRDPDPDDGRCIRAHLTPAGHAAVVAAAPGHAAQVRSLVIDALDPALLAAFTRATGAVLARIDPDGVTRP